MGRRLVRHAPTHLLPALGQYVETSIQQFDQISTERRTVLAQATTCVQKRLNEGYHPTLTFICTHNSRRSHLAQIWAQTAAYYYGVPGVQTFSGGTEATAFHPHAAAAVIRAGFQVENMTEDTNPFYAVRSSERLNPMKVFSKTYDDPINPPRDFCAVMTCSEADEHCPVIPGASCRVALPYDDPKDSDGTPQEIAAYDERCRQISREMFWLFSQVEV